MNESHDELNLILLGKRISRARKEAGLTQDQLSSKIGLSLSHYQSFENGYRGTTLSNIYKIAVVLNRSLDYLFGLNVGGKNDVYADIMHMVDRMTPEEQKMLHAHLALHFDRSGGED